MLTKEDLQAIGELMDSKLETNLAPIKEDVKALKEDVRGLKEDVKGLKEDVEVLKGDIAHIRKQTDVLYDWVDGIDLSVKDLMELHRGA